MKISSHCIMIYAITIALFSSIAYSKNLMNTQIAVGGFFTKKNTSFPLLAVSHDEGLEWVYPPDIISKVPPDLLTASFDKISCNADFCVAAGLAEENAGTDIPLIAVSRDHANAWSYVNLFSKNTQKESFFQNVSSVSCSKKYCVVGLYYNNSQLRAEQCMLVSRNAGKTWSRSFIPEEHPPGILQLPAMECIDERCIAVGWSRFPDSLRVAISKDQASTWSYIKLNLPPPYRKGNLKTVKCRKNTCIAAGNYQSRQGTDILIMRSIDKGASWSIIHPHYQPHAGLMHINHVACSDRSWVISGINSLETNSDKLLPFILTSQNDGLDWFQPSTVISSLPRFPNASVLSGKASCLDHICILPIYTSSDDINLPFTFALLISKDDGISWSYTGIAQPDAESGGMESILCHGQSCFVIGNYVANNNSWHPRPFIISSNNRGGTWYSSDSIFSHLPPDFSSGILSSSALQ